MKINKDVCVMKDFVGGEVEAKKIFHYFIENKLKLYSDDSQDPAKYATSVWIYINIYRICHPIFILVWFHLSIYTTIQWRIVKRVSQ